MGAVAALGVQVDHGPVTPVTFDAFGRFTAPTTFALDGSANGAHVINFQATDALGNVSDGTPFAFTLGTQAPTVSLTSPAADGVLTCRPPRRRSPA